MTKETKQYSDTVERRPDMPYAYKVVEGKVFVTAIVYVCQQCPFKTTDKKAEEEHYYGTEHFLKTTYAEKTEEWDEAKHGPLPSWVKQ